jgi:small redox-active disulfide protein 2
MLSIKVLGPGCANCDRLEKLTRLALEEIKAGQPEVEGTVEKVTDRDRFLDYGLLATPGLVINEKLVSAGRIPSTGQIKNWLQEALDSRE